MARQALLGVTFVELADTLVADYDIIDFLHRLTERSVSLLEVTEAGVALTHPGGPLTVLASSSERMRHIELVEIQAQDGPCLDCWRDGRPVVEHDLASAVHRWPDFAPPALAAGVRSVYAVPMRLRGERIGAMNLFSDRLAGLDEDGQRLAQALADVATIGILHQRSLHHQQSLSEQLQHALNSRVTLEQAKGMVAEQANVDIDRAFELLRGYARRHNRRLSDVASEVVTSGLRSSTLTV